MSLANYADIVASIKSWSQNSELADALYDDFLDMTEAHLNDFLRVAGMSTSVEIPTEAGVDTYDLPAGQKGLRSVEIERSGKRYVLPYFTPETLVDQFGADVGSGIPAGYTLIGSSIRVLPAPAAVYPIWLVHYTKIIPLTSGSPVNWVVTDHPQLYLYGGLHFLAEVVRDDEAAAYWGERFGNAIKAIEAADGKDRWSGSAAAMVAG